MAIPSVPTETPCPLCGDKLRMWITTSKAGRHAVGLRCPTDGRHFKAFINDREYVTATVGKIAAAAGVPVEEVAPPAPITPTPAAQALQNTSTTPAAAKSAKRRRRAG